MTLSEWVRNKLLRFLKIETLSSSPNAQRLTYINDDDSIREANLMENKCWYVGQASELLNYYTGQEVFGYFKNPIYNRNERNYFWGLSSKECNIKRIHTGIPRAIVNTLVNAIGMPIIKVGNGNGISKDTEGKAKETDKLLHDILEYNDFENKYNQEQMPLTLVEGDGCWKPIIDKDFSEYPIWQYYEAENVEYIEKYGRIIGVVFKDYYKDDKGKDYIKLETRRVSQGNSIIEYDLFRLGKNNELTQVELTEIPELADLQPVVIPQLNRILAVPCRFFFDPIYKNRGKSLFAGKVDLFDMLDEIYSQLSQTNRVSTPVEYYNTDVLEHDKNGLPILPNRYDRQFVAKQGIPNGDGLTNNKDIETSQPQLNFNQYIEAAKACMDMILTGQLSPATMGIDIAKRDNADAQREKEKVTIMTRNNIIDKETKIIKDICELSLMLKEYIDTDNITIQDYDISIKYNEFANPSFEQELQILGSARSQGNMSPKMFVELLYGDKISNEEKEEQIKYIEEHDSQDMFNLGGMNDTGGMDNLGGNDNEPTNDNSEDIQESGNKE